MDLTRRAFLFAAALAAVAPAQQQEPPPPANYVVHEWGTFTSMVGGNGLVLDGLHHEEEALPDFVHDLLRVDAFGTTQAKLPASRVTQKMETPVIYFHSDEPLRVAVRVWFEQGLMTQFYPLPNEIFPEFADARQQRIDMSKVRGSFLQWDVDVLPRSGPAPSGIPAVAADDPWAFARQTGASWVRTVPAADSPARPETEHYLFYRGLGRWQPDVTVRCAADGTFVFGSGMPQTVPFCLALELGEHGGRFAVGGAVAGKGSRAFDLRQIAWQKDRERLARLVGAHVMQALVAEGMFVDEARAMVATWSRSWFQKDGARVLYLLPREQVDAVLPLDLQPRPRQVVRALVGRLEFITPAAQQQVEQALDAAQSDDAAARRRAEAVFTGLDRFLEPHLRNVAANGSTAARRGAATARLVAMER